MDSGVPLDGRSLRVGVCWLLYERGSDRDVWCCSGSGWRGSFWRCFRVLIRERSTRKRFMVVWRFLCEERVHKVVNFGGFL